MTCSGACAQQELQQGRAKAAGEPAGQFGCRSYLPFLPFFAVLWAHARGLQGRSPAQEGNGQDMVTGGTAKSRKAKGNRDLTRWSLLVLPADP